MNTDGARPMPRKEKMLAMLSTWMTPMRALEEARCMSLNARVAEYRAAGCAIVSEWVQAPSGARIKRHRLDEPVAQALDKWRARPRGRRVLEAVEGEA